MSRGTKVHVPCTLNVVGRGGSSGWFAVVNEACVRACDILKGKVR